ncbi:acyltransferase family protein [Humitalea rosea]|uniref:acyltransferase family protein n=1 Tax=Humitalea rosea TaxID=990373 RepID=UPI001314332E|nr:acyltransferase [Humitalea rosea]
MTDKINWIQWLRAIAAIEVILWHSDLVTKHFSPALIGSTAYSRFGGFGVELFFIISGYIICLTAKKYQSGALFMMNRIVRLLPAYWFFTLLVFLAVWIEPAWRQHSLSYSSDVILKSLLFFPQQDVPVLALGWSLEHEMIFYLIVALALVVAGAFTFTRQIVVALLLTALGVAGFMLGTGLGQRFWDYHVMSPYMVAFAFGWIFRLADTSAPSRKTLLYLIPMATLLTLASVPIDPSEQPLLERIALAAVLFVAAGSLGAVLERGNIVNRFMARIGDASYSIYLSHWFCLSVIGKVLGRIAPPAEFDVVSRAGAVMVAILFGLAFFDRVERPVDVFLKRALRLGRRPGSSIALPGAAAKLRPIVSDPGIIR